MAFHELRIHLSPASRERLINLLTEKGALGFVEDDEAVVAYFPDSVEITPLLRELELMRMVVDKVLGPSSGQFSFVHAVIPDQDWNESWKKSFQPVDIGERFTIVPPWETGRSGRINLVIDPGMAFGTGHHETTRSCLVLMERYERRMAKERFLDIGTGTGILAIAAAKLGYRHVVAVDTDPLAVEAARKNASLNQVQQIDVREGSVQQARGKFDCIAANILSGVLVLLAEDIAHRLAPAGIAVLSGILQEQAGEVIAAMQQAGLQLKDDYCDGKWRSLAVASSASPAQ